MSRVLVVFSSLFGANAELAVATEDVLHTLGAQVRVRGVEQIVLADAVQPAAAGSAVATLDDLEWADALIFSSPSHTGLPSAAIKAFIDEHHEAAVAGKFLNKPFTALATSGFAHAGQERVVDDLNAVAAAWGCVLVTPSTANPTINSLDGNPYGLSFVLSHGKLPELAQVTEVLTAHLTRFVAITNALAPLTAGAANLRPTPEAPLRASDVFG